MFVLSFKDKTDILTKRPASVTLGLQNNTEEVKVTRRSVSRRKLQILFILYSQTF